VTERVLPIHGVELNVAVDGEPDATPLALLNGAYSNLHSWTPVMPQLLERFRVIRHDWRGSGRSSGGARADYGFPQYADDLAAILDHLEIPRAVVCGLAYGARTAARFALRHPGRTELLALYDVSLDQPVDQELQRAGNAEAKALRDAAGLASVERDPAWFEHEHQKEAMRSLTAHRDQPDPTPELAMLQIPTLVVCGRQDVNLGEAQRIADILPDAEYRILEMAGHGSTFSRPDLVAEYLIDFVDRTQQR
jgi:3-oxoadipate enol-lactonase